MPLLLLGGELVALRDKLGVQRTEIGGQAIVGLVGPVEQRGRTRAFARVLGLEQDPEVGARVLVRNRCPPLRDGAQLRPTRLPGLDLLLERRDLVAEHPVASLDLRVSGGGFVGLLPGVGGRLTARRARQQRDRAGRDRAGRDENAPDRRKLAHSHEPGR